MSPFPRCKDVAKIMAARKPSRQDGHSTALSTATANYPPKLSRPPLRLFLAVCQRKEHDKLVISQRLASNGDKQHAPL